MSLSYGNCNSVVFSLQNKVDSSNPFMLIYEKLSPFFIYKCDQYEHVSGYADMWQRSLPREDTQTESIPIIKLNSLHCKLSANFNTQFLSGNTCKLIPGVD